MWDKQTRMKELQRQRSRQINWSTIIKQVEEKYGSTDLQNDQLFMLIYKALEESGFELHESDTQRYQKIKTERTRSASAD
jgi:hypothetical protein